MVPVRTWAIAVLVVLASLPGGQAIPGSVTVRILAPGDAYVVALSASCPDPAYDPADPLRAHCWLAHDMLGYDGVTGAALYVPAEVGGSFTCAVVASATAPVGSALPFPANLAVSDSIVVGFPETDFPSSYGGRFQRPMLGEVTWRVVQAAYDGDGNALVSTPEWYLANAQLGPTPSVTGTVDHAFMVIWNQGGFDVTVDCGF